MTDIGAKVAHVLAAKAGDDKHTCHWPGCGRVVPPAAWGCKPHWFKLPADLRRLIWTAYKPGQEVSKTPSREYLAAAQKVQDWIAANSGKK